MGTQQCLSDRTFAPCACGGSTAFPGQTGTGPAASDPSNGTTSSSATTDPLPEPTEPLPEPIEPPPEPTEPPPEPIEPPPPNPGDPFDALRQACVDHINMYRATLGLAPLARANSSVELCSDDGAELDASLGQAHASAGECPGLGGQNTCPGWNPDWYGGSEQGALLACLDAMWAEGEPPVSRQQCIADRYGCFLDHGHYLNMSSTSYSVVSCGFYRMPDGDIWMNQDFGR